VKSNRHRLTGDEKRATQNVLSSVLLPVIEAPCPVDHALDLSRDRVASNAVDDLPLGFEDVHDR